MGKSHRSAYGVLTMCLVFNQLDFVSNQWSCCPDRSWIEIFFFLHFFSLKWKTKEFSIKTILLCQNVLALHLFVILLFLSIGLGWHACLCPPYYAQRLQRKSIVNRLHWAFYAVRFIRILFTFFLSSIGCALWFLA